LLVRQFSKSSDARLGEQDVSNENSDMAELELLIDQANRSTSKHTPIHKFNGHFPGKPDLAS